MAPWTLVIVLAGRVKRRVSDLCAAVALAVEPRRP